MKLENLNNSNIWYFFRLFWGKLDTDGVAVLSSAYDSSQFSYCRKKQGGKPGLGFKASLFCLNWKFTNTCWRSVRYSYLEKW